jgi:hypothetical protein
MRVACAWGPTLAGNEPGRGIHVVIVRDRNDKSFQGGVGEDGFLERFQCIKAVKRCDRPRDEHRLERLSTEFLEDEVGGDNGVLVPREES